MPKNKATVSGGFTLVELMVAVAVAAIVIFAIGVVVVDGQRGWHRMYNRINSDVVADSHVATKTFNAVIRKASREKSLMDEGGDWIEVYYYNDPDSAAADCYARFYVADGHLNLEYGKLAPRETLTIIPICENVSDCVFKKAGCSAQMMLTLDNGSQMATVVSSAVMHNE